MKILLLTAVLALGATALQDDVKPGDKLEQHKWLEQFVGEWTVTAKTVMAPGSPSIEWEYEESIRSIGGLWIVAEGTAEYEGEPFTALLTVGYDPNHKAFVGSWIDTLQTTMWTYVGHLDAAKRVLTLEAEGPSLTDPGETDKYREQIEFISPDHKRMTSSYLDGEGTWTAYMTLDARRDK